MGAEPLAGGGTHFRVWAPRRRKVDVVVERAQKSGPGRVEITPMEAEEGGYFSGTVGSARAGTLYRFRCDSEEALFPDPASRFQPDGPHGPSQVVDPAAYSWTDREWKGTQRDGQVLYEMHVGTFTREGTWKAAARELEALAELGVTALEIMPVAEFPGRFGWGYDGSSLFAPTHLYGTPDDFRRFVDRSHAVGLGVILDVVYNHFGPDGCYLHEFSEAYFTKKYKNEWGDAINFDGEDSGPVREFFLANAAYWIEEFHLDGLRLDATQQIFDDSPHHILADISHRVRESARGRATLLVGENEPQEVRLVRPPDEGGYGLDAVWNDDFHHSAMVAMTGRKEAYYTDYLGNPQEFISAAKYGYLYQGQWYRWQQKPRGTSGLRISPAAFVNFLQNHDQVANSGLGLRCHELTSPGRYRALTALMLLMPGTPMLFQGQEFASSARFLYFADHEPELAKVVAEGRRESLRQFPSLALPEMQERLPEPSDMATFERCKLDFSERERHAEIYALHRDLLRLRREDLTFRIQRPGALDGAVLGPQAFVLRFLGDDENHRLLLVNLGVDLHLPAAPEPLLAPPQGKRWVVRWSSNDPSYGGGGTPPPDTEMNWRIPAESAVVLAADDPKRDRAQVSGFETPSRGAEVSGATAEGESAGPRVSVYCKVAGGPWFVALTGVPGADVELGPFENPAIARKNAEKMRAVMTGDRGVP